MRKEKTTKKVLKKPYNFLKKATYSLLLANGVFFGHQGYVAYRISENNDKPNKQIFKDAEVFSSDLENYFKDTRSAKKLRRFSHNGNEPIYVQLSKGFSDDEIKKIKSSFNYIENIFKDINPNYRFEFVDNNLANKLAGKVTIDVAVNNEIGAEGRAFVRGYSIFRSDYLINPKIEIKTQNGAGHEWFEETVLHEILHLFQMKDLYPNVVGKEVSTSVIFIDSYTNEIPELTPQDYRALHTIYNSSHIVNGKVDKQKLASTLELINNYEQNYYSVRANLLRDYSSVKYNYQNITSENANNHNIVFDRALYKMSVQLNEGGYSFKVTDKKSGDIISEHKGNYLVVDGVVVLKDVETERRFYNSMILSNYNRIADLMVVQTDRNIFRIVDVADIASSLVVDKSTLDFDIVDLRNKFFENKQNYENNKQKTTNKMFSTPSGYKFSIEMDEEKDELLLFR